LHGSIRLAIQQKKIQPSILFYPTFTTGYRDNQLGGIFYQENVLEDGRMNEDGKQDFDFR
jgi:hypothetical protein